MQSSDLYSSSEPASMPPIAEAEEIEQLRWIEGYEEAQAIADVQFKRLQLVEIIDNIVDLISITQDLPSNWQSQRLKISFLAKDKQKQKDIQLVDASYKLRAALDEFKISHLEVDIETAFGQSDRAILIANDFAHAIRRLIESEEPSAAELQDVLSRHGIDKIHQITEAMRTLLPKIGAKSEPLAITKLVLERTKILRQEHSDLETADEVMTAFVNELRTREDVQEWESFRSQLSNDKNGAPGLGATMALELKRRSVHVRAFQQYSGMNQSELGSVLRSMKKDNPNYK